MNWETSFIVALGVLAAFLVSLIITVIRLKKNRQAVALLADSLQQKKLFVNFYPRNQLLKACFLMLGMIALALAFLRPQWGKKEVVLAGQGRDLLIALDISRSMLAQDIEPSRLEAAKKKIHALVSSLKPERVGLILFAGSALVQCPLTTDKIAFFMFLDAVDNRTVTSSTTALDTPIKKALEIYKNIEDSNKKVVVIFTDGEDFGGNLAMLKEAVRKAQLHIFTLGIGTAEGAPIPQFNAEGNRIGYEKEKSGKIAISHLNEDLLRSLSQNSGGRYIYFARDCSDIKKLESYLSNYEKVHFEETRIEQRQERFYYFLAIALIAFLLEWLL